jgi:hypothetical protein
MLNFNSVAFTQTIFQVNLRNFLKKISKISNSEKMQIEHRKRHLLRKFKPSSIFTIISKVILIFFTPEFAIEISKFQNSEYEVHQSSPLDEG